MHDQNGEWLATVAIYFVHDQNGWNLQEWIMSTQEVTGGVNAGKLDKLPSNFEFLDTRTSFFFLSFFFLRKEKEIDPLASKINRLCNQQVRLTCSFPGASGILTGKPNANEVRISSSLDWITEI